MNSYTIYRKDGFLSKKSAEIAGLRNNNKNIPKRGILDEGDYDFIVDCLYPKNGDNDAITTIPVGVKASHTIYEVKQAIQNEILKQIGETCSISLLKKTDDTILENDNYTLQYYGINGNVSIHVDPFTNV